VGIAVAAEQANDVGPGCLAGPQSPKGVELLGDDVPVHVFRRS
jgi:hypothetical protein